MSRFIMSEHIVPSFFCITSHCKLCASGISSKLCIVKFCSCWLSTTVLVVCDEFCGFSQNFLSRNILTNLIAIQHFILIFLGLGIVLLSLILHYTEWYKVKFHDFKMYIPLFYIYALIFISPRCIFHWNLMNFQCLNVLVDVHFFLLIIFHTKYMHLCLLYFYYSVCHSVE